jgi:hypothetical protein
MSVILALILTVIPCERECNRCRARCNQSGMEPSASIKACAKDTKACPVQNLPAEEPFPAKYTVRCYAPGGAPLDFVADTYLYSHPVLRLERLGVVVRIFNAVCVVSGLEQRP